MVNSTTKRILRFPDLKGTKRLISVEDFYSSRVSENINKEGFFTLKDSAAFCIYAMGSASEKKLVVWVTKMV